MLMMRQKVFQNAPSSGFSLMEQERVDGMKCLDWEEQVRRNHEEMAKRFAK